MSKQVILLIILITSFSLPSNAIEFEFPNMKLRGDIATELLSGLESIDAVTIDLRNKTRRISWQDYKQLVNTQITNAEDWNSLYRAIDNIHYGILNRHSYLVVAESIEKNVRKPGRWPKLNIGFTWPNISFFDISSNKSIDDLNGKSIKVLYDEFYNLYCNDVFESSCLVSFSRFLKNGYFFKGNEDEITLKYSDGTSLTIGKKSKAKASKSRTSTGSRCSDRYKDTGMELLYEGDQTCLLQNDEAYVLRITHFGDWGTQGDDIYCEKTLSKGMCSDIKAIKSITNDSPPKPLIIDLQNNGGGNENTPWIAALTKNGFKDNLIQYRNLLVLKDPDIRMNAFYGNSSAENWYQSNQANINNQDQFWPKRPDFCRGSDACDIKTIPSANQPINYTELKLVINGGCVSSCDDFVWRTKQYAGAKTFGQMSATDGAYARLNGYLFLEKNNLTTIITGEGMPPKHAKGILIASYMLPISKTVTPEGLPLEGDGSILDYPLEITQDNFSGLILDNLRRAMSH